MSHNLDQLAPGQYAFASAREHAWHRLGTVVDHAMNAEEALSLAHLSGWNVRKVALETRATDTEQALPIPGSYATVRTNPITGLAEPLGVVGGRYTPIQNEEHTDMLNALLHESAGHFETAGALRGGRVVFVSTRIPADFNVGGVDSVGLYLIATNSHDGSSPFQLAVTSVRVVCQNTLQAALGAARSHFSIRHTRSFRSNIAAAQQALGLAFKYRDAFALEAERLINEQMSEGQFEKYIETLFPTPLHSAPPLTRERDNARKEQLRRLFAASPTMTEIKGTQWSGYQAITEYLDHSSRVNVNRWSASPNEARALRAISPASIALKERAFSIIGR